MLEESSEGVGEGATPRLVDVVEEVVVVVEAGRRIEGDGSSPLMLREGRARIRVCRMYCCGLGMTLVSGLNSGGLMQLGCWGVDGRQSLTCAVRDARGMRYTSLTSSSTLVLYASSPAGAAAGGIARSIFSRAACFMFSSR